MASIFKYIVLTICVLLTHGNLFAQSDSIKSLKCDSITTYIASLVEDVDMRIYQHESVNRYKLYPTDNIYNFLKLDTKTGQIEQVQWSLDTNKEGSVSINREDLSWNSVIGTFELYPTQNMYQFVLLDKSNGRTWHIQWGMEDKKRWIRRIY